MNAALSSPDMAAAEGETWRVAGQARWRLWEDEAVVYNGRTGDTHHLADFAAWVFAALCRSPASAAGLARESLASVELRSGETPEAAITRTLDLLRRLTLIEKTRPETER
ncbi:MAG: HPr-rel-A system PqqD family peptide chaperone [Stellaceae bacterium]|jgi:PqqD family protein of HPr-rel-A system